LFWAVVPQWTIVVTAPGIDVNDAERALVFDSVRFAFKCSRVV
jgi:hypothetical protein